VNRAKPIFVFVYVPLVFASAAVVARTIIAINFPKTVPALECPSRLDLGPQESQAIAVGHVRVRNNGRADLVIDHLRTTCSCATVGREEGGKFLRVDSLRLASGQEAELAVRVGVSVRPGTAQAVSVQFESNDPAHRRWAIRVLVPRVRGGGYAEPFAVVFGELRVGEASKRLIDIYDNGTPGRRIGRATFTNGDRCVARVIPVEDRAAPRLHATAGSLIGRVEVVAHSAKPGPLNGLVEVSLADENRPPLRIPVVGAVVGSVRCAPASIVFPRCVGGNFSDSADLLLSHADGKPIRVDIVSLPPGFRMQINEVPGHADQRMLHVDWLRGRTEASLGATQILLRAFFEGNETPVNIDALCTEIIP